MQRPLLQRAGYVGVLSLAEQHKTAFFFSYCLSFLYINSTLVSQSSSHGKERTHVFGEQPFCVMLNSVFKCFLKVALMRLPHTRNLSMRGLAGWGGFSLGFPRDCDRWKES